MFDLNNIVRKNIRNLLPYSSARDEYTGKTGVFLDANENSLGSVSVEKNNRYPDPYQYELKTKLSEVLEVKSVQILLGN
jgi:histidinol-phosphate aminotransferase